MWRFVVAERFLRFGSRKGRTRLRNARPCTSEERSLGKPGVIGVKGASGGGRSREIFNQGLFHRGRDCQSRQSLASVLDDCSTVPSAVPEHLRGRGGSAPAFGYPGWAPAPAASCRSSRCSCGRCSRPRGKARFRAAPGRRRSPAATHAQTGFATQDNTERVRTKVPTSATAISPAPRARENRSRFRGARLPRSDRSPGRPPDERPGAGFASPRRSASDRHRA